MSLNTQKQFPGADVSREADKLDGEQAPASHLKPHHIISYEQCASDSQVY